MASAEEEDLVELLSDVDSAGPDTSVDAEALRAALSRAQADRCRAAATAAAAAAAAAEEQFERTVAALALAQKGYAAARADATDAVSAGDTLQATGTAVAAAQDPAATVAEAATSAPASPRRPIPRAGQPAVVSLSHSIIRHHIISTTFPHLSARLPPPAVIPPHASCYTSSPLFFGT